MVTGNGGRGKRSWSRCCCPWMHRKGKWSGMLQNSFIHLWALLVIYFYSLQYHIFLPDLYNWNVINFGLFMCFIFPVQVRFELTFFSLNPDLQVVAPWREWDITGREDAIEYAKKHNVPVPVTKKSIYSRDRNLWHLSHEVQYLFIADSKPHL